MTPVYEFYSGVRMRAENVDAPILFVLRAMHISPTVRVRGQELIGMKRW